MGGNCHQTEEIWQQYDRICHDVSNYMKMIGQLAEEGENRKILDVVSEVSRKLESGNRDA